ncbi:hypothetical protein M9H77_19508 [Catharanthus roseus]|uniref:Uncharacterized protein n=1 Tax=Catharanthus roseus TaxID=4058 RepID=A0ACC0BAK4_CATRO|nr:hypothetical protein M9H77_19508 [Catharanthus roseus]
MARKKQPARNKRAGKESAGVEKQPTRAERSAYFARREAAKVLGCVLQGDARRRAVASIKSLVYSPTVRNKKATYALVCQTLKYLPVIKDVLRAASFLNGKWKRQEHLINIIAYDILFGQEASLIGEAERFVLHRKDELCSALTQLLSIKKVKNVEDLMPLYKISNVSKPRYVRVNTLKMDVDSALLELSKQYVVNKDDLVPDLLVLPPGTDLHNHQLVTSGNIFLQGKASSMVAVALEPEPGWQVLDACSAPGNKTVHLAALMKGKGKIIACELDEKRVERLKYTVSLAGASNVKVKHEDFLNLDPKDRNSLKIQAILLDPSCSGSGTVIDRLDHLLPSYTAGSTGTANVNRLTKLAAFQKKALEHAFSFPAVERIVYSTCSLHQIENEDVIRSVLPLAASHGFQLSTIFPQWPRRGLPVVDGYEHLIRTSLEEDGEGFFIALFVRETAAPTNGRNPEEAGKIAGASADIIHKTRCLGKKKKMKSYFFSNMLRMLLYSSFHATKQTPLNLR